MRNFRELVIWKESKEIAKSIYKLSALLPKDELYGLKSQIQKSSVSISSNIAEGCSRSSDLDFKRFLEMALGSTFELETQLIIIEETGLVSNEKLIEIFNNISLLQKRLNSFISHLKSSIYPKANT
ncbi:MAG: four helix bundle protein [Microscillaceae bacterium]|nr:four helix bundle protein [Microscillaceae bacterium]